MGIKNGAAFQKKAYVYIKTGNDFFKTVILSFFFRTGQRTIWNRAAYSTALVILSFLSKRRIVLKNVIYLRLTSKDRKFRHREVRPWHFVTETFCHMVISRHRHLASGCFVTRHFVTYTFRPRDILSQDISSQDISSHHISSQEI